jgi:hypothetical protein
MIDEAMVAACFKIGISSLKGGLMIWLGRGVNGVTGKRFNGKGRSWTIDA